MSTHACTSSDRVAGRWTEVDADPVFACIDYDATAHISEEVKRAAYAAPAAIVVGVSLPSLLYLHRSHP